MKIGETCPDEFPKNGDEVTIFQFSKDGSKRMAFKGFLRVGGECKLLFKIESFVSICYLFKDRFTFKSERSVDDQLHLLFTINESPNNEISICCEGSFDHGSRVGDDNSFFWFYTTDQSDECPK